MSNTCYAIWYQKTKWCRSYQAKALKPGWNFGKLRWFTDTNLLTPFGKRKNCKRLLLHLFIKDNKTDCGNYWRISLLPIPYKILPDIPLSKLTSCLHKIIGNHQHGFPCDWLTTDQIFYIHEKLEKNKEFKGADYQLFIYF